MKKLAIIDKCPGSTDYFRYMPFLQEYKVELLHLSSEPLKKLLVKDIDLEIDTDDYDYILLIGSEAAKRFAKITSVTAHAGHLVDEKFIPMINPAMLAFKPEAAKSFEVAVTRASRFISGEWVPPSGGDYIGIQDEAEAIAYIQSCLNDLSISVMAIDTEDSSLYPRDGFVLGVSLSHRTEQGVYIDANVCTDVVISLIQQLIDNKKIVMHNAKFDIKWLNYHFGLIFPPDVEDTMLLHYCLDETQGTHGLKALALKYTNLGDYDKDLDKFKKDYCKLHKMKQADFSYDLIPFDIMYPYAAMDTAATLELYFKFKPIIERSPQLTFVYEKLLRPGMRFLNEMEENGVPFSVGRLNIAKAVMEEDLARLKADLYTYPEITKFEEIQGKIFNPNSTVQLRSLLFDMLGLHKTGKKTATGADSTDAEVMGELAKQHKIPALILEIKQTVKIKNTYLDKIVIALDRDNRLRTGFNLTSTTSGRLSSSGKLNMQQLPRDNKIVKACIKARKGYTIVSQDLGTAEMYYAAVLSGDKKLMKIFQDKGDFHSAVAKMVFDLPCTVEEVKALYPGERQAAKAISFGIMYGSGPAKVSATVSEFNREMSNKNGTPYVAFTVEDAKDAISTYFGTYKRLAKWLKECKANIEQNGYIYSALGRKRRLPNVFSKDRGIAAAEVRSGVNFLVQSVASDINLMAAMDLHQHIKNNDLDIKIFALVHDSILCEVRDDLVDDFIETMKVITQRDRGLTIPGSPITVDAETGVDYSFLDQEAVNDNWPGFRDAA